MIIIICENARKNQNKQIARLPLDTQMMQERRNKKMMNKLINFTLDRLKKKSNKLISRTSNVQLERLKRKKKAKVGK